MDETLTADRETTVELTRSHLRTTVAVGTTAIAALAIACALTDHAIAHHVRVEIDNLSQCAVPLIAAIWCLVSTGFAVIHNRKKSDGAAHSTFVPAVLLTLGSLAFVIGQAIWSFYELVLNVATPFPSWADAGFLTAYPFLFLGVLTLPAKPVSRSKRIVILFECLLVMSAVFAFSWFFVLGPTILSASGSLLAKVLGSAYPICDIGLIFSLIFLFFRSGSSQLNVSVSILGAGLLSIIGIDTVFDYQTLHNTYNTGHAIDLGWTVGYTLVVIAAQSTLGLKVPKSVVVETPKKTYYLGPPHVSMFRRIAGLGPILIQYAIFPPIAFLVWYASRPGVNQHLQDGVNVGAGLIVLSLLMRQYFMLVETSELTRELKTIGENLEEVVKDRTRELSVRTDQLVSLQSLSSAINANLETTSVLEVAAQHTKDAFKSNGIGIWLLDDHGELIDDIPSASVGVGQSTRLMRQAAETAISDFTTECRIDIESIGGEPAESFAYLQGVLQSRGIVMGKIGVFRSEGSFTEEEVSLLDSICLHVATALDNARQFWNAKDAADRDSLTQLLNHRAIHEYLDTAIELESFSNEPLAVILADIDNFHMFNDTYGHPIGDEVLMKVATVLSATCKAPCKVGRYSGDEFIVVLPGFTSEQTVEVAKEMQLQIADLQLHYANDERTIPVSLSFGIACFPEDSTQRQDLLVTADSNLSKAKNSDAHIIALSEMQRQSRELRVSSSFRMLDGMVTAVDNKDRYTRRHSEDVTEFALSIADELGLDDDLKRILRIGGLLHDVGKIGVPDEILRKPGRLDDEEYEVMKQHPTLGALIVGGVSGMDDIIDAVKYHHEHWDGTGYPERLAGSDIPFIARLLAVADAMSAMTTDRPYRKGMAIEKALSQVRKGSGTQFDPDMAAAFLRVAKTRYNLDESQSTTDLHKAA